MRASLFYCMSEKFERGEPLMSLDFDQGEALLEEGRASAFMLTSESSLICDTLERRVDMS